MSASFVFSWSALPVLVVGLGQLGLAIAVVVRERASRASVTFLVACGSIAAWLLGYAVIYSLRDAAVALWWIRLMTVAVAFIPTSLYTFALAMTGRLFASRGRVLACLGISACFAATALLTDWFVSGLYQYWWGYYARYGWLSVPFLVFFGILLGMSLRLYRDASRTAVDAVARHRARRLFTAFAVAYFGSFDYLPAYGLEVYAIGYLPILVFIVLAARSIWRDRLVEFTAALAAENILETLQDGVVICDASGLIRVANRAVSSTFGYAPEELVGRPLERLAADGRGTLDALYAALRTGDIRDAEMRFARKNGEPVDVSVSVSVLQKNGHHGEDAPGRVLLVRDITERKRAQAVLAGKMRELERLNKIMVGREERIMELKQEVERLRAERGTNGSDAAGAAA